MNKSVYSLVLMDNLVDAVDRLAYRKGTSRSNMINQIIADYLGMMTPEKRIHDIFLRLEETMGSKEEFQVLFSPSDSTMSIKSSLRYKYNPTIRYSVILYRKPDEVFGELRVLIRTQSADFLAALERFFLFWAELENKYLSVPVRYEISDGKYIRKFLLPHEMVSEPDERLGEAIARYVQMFNSVLKLYFEDTENLSVLKNRYLQYLKTEETVI